MIIKLVYVYMCMCPRVLSNPYTVDSYPFKTKIKLNYTVFKDSV